MSMPVKKCGMTTFFNRLYLEYSLEMRHWIARSRVPKHLQADVLQEIWITAFRRIDKLLTHPRPDAWLRRVGRNLMYHSHRYLARQHRKVAAIEVLGHPGHPFAASATPHVERDTQEFLQQVLQRIPNEQREVFLRVEIWGESAREIAESLGIPDNTVTSRLRLARERIRHLSQILSIFLISFLSSKWIKAAPPREGGAIDTPVRVRMGGFGKILVAISALLLGPQDKVTTGEVEDLRSQQRTPAIDIVIPPPSKRLFERESSLFTSNALVQRAQDNLAIHVEDLRDTSPEQRRMPVAQRVPENNDVRVHQVRQAHSRRKPGTSMLPIPVAFRSFCTSRVHGPSGSSCPHGPPIARVPSLFERHGLSLYVLRHEGPLRSSPPTSPDHEPKPKAAAEPDISAVPSDQGVALISLARHYLKVGEPLKAQEELNRHKRDYPDSQLALTREFLLFPALRNAGQIQESNAKLRENAREHPEAVGYRRAAYNRAWQARGRRERAPFRPVW